MNINLKYGLILFIIVMISASVLAFVNTITEPKIAENKRIAEYNARKEVFPMAYTFVEFDTDEISFFKVYDQDENLLGYTFIATARDGYSGIIRTMVGLNHDMTINKINVLEHSETPGLGAKCTSPDFTSLFSGLRRADLFIDKDGGRITTITGSTITTRAITNSIRRKVDLLITFLENIDD